MSHTENSLKDIQKLFKQLGAAKED